MPSAPLRRCRSAGCQRRQAEAWCPAHVHLSPRRHYGRTRREQGYDAAYERARQSLLGRPCEMRLEGCTAIATTAQHTDEGSLIPACAHCNYADGARRRGHGRQPSAPPPPPSSPEWFA